MRAQWDAMYLDGHTAAGRTATVQPTRTCVT